MVFRDFFCCLEADHNLDPLNEVDIYCLQFVFTHYINESLSSFVEGWNNHAVSSANHQTPRQMLIASLMEQSDDSDLSEEETLSVPQNSDAVAVPRCSFHPCIELCSELEASYYPLPPAIDHGKSIYLAVINTVGRHLTTNCAQCIS